MTRKEAKISSGLIFIIIIKYLYWIDCINLGTHVVIGSTLTFRTHVFCLYRVCVWAYFLPQTRYAIHENTWGTRLLSMGLLCKRKKRKEKKELLATVASRLYVARDRWTEIY